RHQGRSLVLIFGPRAEAVGLEAPGDLELVEIRFVDVDQRRIVGVAEVGAVAAPLARGAALAVNDNRTGDPGDAARENARSGAFHDYCCCWLVEVTACFAFRSSTSRLNSGSSR